MIVVFGSINMDVNMRLHTFPQPGETVVAPSYEMSPGGKGANQSLAAARGGVKTALIGKVGDDAMAHRLLIGLRRNEVVTSGVAVSEVLPTGMAFITCDRTGENQIVVASGANADIQASQVPNEILKAGNIVMFQMETPLAENIALMERAKANGASVMLNLAPAIEIPQKALELVDYLVVNEHEARYLGEIFGIARTQQLPQIAKFLSEKGKLDCIVTLGEKGAFALTKTGQHWRVPALPVKEMGDTIGAGDCFCGTLAAALHEKQTLGAAMRRASVAASLSCTRKGAQESYPYIAEVDEALKGFPQAELVS
ncbi:MAG: ribokinase [Micavibrio sp.]